MSTTTISATLAKLQFGSILAKVKEGNPYIIEKNNKPEVVLISVDDYEDFLELKDKKFQNKIVAGYKEIQKGKAGNMAKLYKIHQATIIKEAK